MTDGAEDKWRKQGRKEDKK